jgi:hypothetical protein
MVGGKNTPDPERFRGFMDRSAAGVFRDACWCLTCRMEGMEVAHG